MVNLPIELLFPDYRMFIDSLKAGDNFHRLI
jgi:hypothetical protein